MKTIELKDKKFLSTSQGYQFIPIGNHDRIFGPGSFMDQLKDRIFKRNSAPLEDFWATLGRQDGKEIDWSGNLLCSGKGNDTSIGITAEEIDLLKKLHPEITLNQKKALEKVLVFDQVTFGTDEGSRLIRLSVMVEPENGALVYYQHTTKDDTRSELGDIEYIQPQENPNYNDNQRDRLDYFFRVPTDLSDINRFIVKVITFSRNPSKNPEDLLNKLEKPHRLLRFNTTSNSFDDISANGIPAAERTLKTLLLLHGTFSTTANSFAGLLSSNWLQQILKDKTYDQIIALDHPTVFAGPAENIAEMVKLMGTGPKFTNNLHIITTSRGGLCGKTIVNDANIHNTLFSVDRVAAQACANGVEYFTEGWKISKGLSVFKMLFQLSGRSGLEMFTAIAQTGVNFFLRQPGCVAMTIGSAPLTAILNGIPANPDMRYFPVTGNYVPDNFKQRVLNLMVRAVYNDRPNDWVVGTMQQAIMPLGNYAYGKTKNWDYTHYFETTDDSIHTLYLKMDTAPPDQVARETPRDAIKKFLQDTDSNIQ
jgi:hypothetical protein